jgi:GT2 family glycosyltransferase
MNGADPLVSVVVVNYNAGRLLDHCLDSLAARRPEPPAEVILVDNASTDGSAELAAGRHPGVTLIRAGHNLGFAGGVNLGAAHAAGEILFLLNPDAEIWPDTLGPLAGALAADPRLAVAGCKIYDPDRTTLQHVGGVIHPSLITSHVGRGEEDRGQYDEPADVDYVTGAALAVRRSAWDELGGLDPGYRPGYYEETELCLRARRRGYRVAVVPSARALHHESVSSGKLSARFFYRYHRNRLRFLIRNHGPFFWFGRFAPAEARWLISSLPGEQRLPLLRAYLVTMFRFPLTLVGR